MKPPPDVSSPTAPTRPNRRETIELIREDRLTNGGAWTCPGFQALLAIRVGQHVRSIGNPIVRKPVTVLYKLLRRRARTRFGIEVHASMTVGRRVTIAHQGAIVFHEYTVIGDDCVIRQSATLGGIDTWKRDEHPTLGRNVGLGAGAAIVGKVTVGDNARIGPNAVVTNHVPPGALVVAPKSRVITFSSPGSD